MKSWKLAGISAIAGLCLAGVASPVLASAADKDGKTEDHSTTDVEVIDNTKPEDNSFELQHVPTKYSFETALAVDGIYTIDSAKDIQDGMIQVTNNTSTRAWWVTATAALDNYDLTGFTIGEHNLMGTSADKIVFQSKAEDNVGTYTTPVEAASISFADAGHTLKLGSHVTGTITYNLTDVAPVE